MGLAHTLFLLHAWRPFLHCPFWSARALLRGLHPGVPGPQTSNRCFQASGPGRQGLPLASSGASTGSALRDSGPPQPHCIHSPNPHGAKGTPLATPVSYTHPGWLLAFLSPWLWAQVWGSPEPGMGPGRRPWLGRGPGCSEPPLVRKLVPGWEVRVEWAQGCPLASRPAPRPGTFPWLHTEVAGALGLPRVTAGQQLSRWAFSWLETGLWVRPGACGQPTGRASPGPRGDPSGLAPSEGRAGGRGASARSGCDAWDAWLRGLGEEEGDPRPHSLTGETGWGGPSSPRFFDPHIGHTRGVSPHFTDRETEAQSPPRACCSQPGLPGVSSLPESFDISAHKAPCMPSGCPWGPQRPLRTQGPVGLASARLRALRPHHGPPPSTPASRGAPVP